ncbi:putative clathrin assembly protein At1g25240 [Phragmites australis]|uniref:putative clathrin assembly protein At1g25240 n=1 Tax=Phragmites australis TaxID=29695 RepID=UPI002D79984A|nr:putative clathrin assembly protein At1g25240 [Phragmites australis]
MASVRQWWRRAAAALKDRRSLLLARVRPRRAGSWHKRELEAAVIRATSHEDRGMDYRSAARVFAWARTSPSFLRPVMWALARRARRTRCWVVALKALMIAHGLLLRSGLAPPAASAGRVPFELADFRDRSSSRVKSVAFSAFVRAYFRFLDYRSLFAAQEDIDGDDTGCSSDYQTAWLDRIAKQQFLLELLLQIRPYGDGIEVALVLEAMDCALIEIFRVYGQICTGIARFLVSGVPGPAKPWMRKAVAAAVVRMLWRAAEQSAQLASYFELCRGLGVVNARRVPAAFVRVTNEDVRALERILMGDAQDETKDDEQGEKSAPVDVKGTGSASTITAAVATEWVAFDEEKPIAGAGACSAGSEGRVASHWNPFVVAPLDVREGGNLIELL